MTTDSDAVVIGAGVAGTATAILLTLAGWRVTVVEQHAFPRRKVCGECIAAGNLPLLDRLGIGAAFQRAAGPELRRLGWMDARGTLRADMPPCTEGPYAYGRALGRDRLDAMLLERARALGVTVLQPVTARAVRGAAGAFDCEVESRLLGVRTLRTSVVVDAHGSWERGAVESFGREHAAARSRRGDADLLAFKAVFLDSALEPGFLPVLALDGAYGGMVLGDAGRTTLACCIRRDTLASARARLPAMGAGAAVEELLCRSCPGISQALRGARRDGAWLAVGPLRPGVRVDRFHGVFRVGNAAGESHPLIGEGISMALQSAQLLAAGLTRQPVAAIRGDTAARVHQRYARAWRRAFVPRLRLAAVYAHIAMTPALAAPARALLGRMPQLLHRAARLAGKAARAADPSSLIAETV